MELLGVVWALDYFKHYLYGQYFTVQTDHRALLSILKDKSTKAHQSRLTRWCDRLIPFHFQIKHIPGSKMGLTDYISRKPHNKAKPISRYDEDFVIAQIDAIIQTINAIKQRGRPRKLDNLESLDDSKALTKKPEIKRPRDRPQKLPLQSQDDSKIKVPRAQSHKTKPQAVQKLHNYSLRRKQVLPNTENHETIDAASLTKVEQQTIAKAHLPNNSATEQSLLKSKHNFEMSNQQPSSQQTPPTSSAKNPISFSTYLSPEKDARPTKADTQLDKAIRDVFSSTLIAAVTNRDSVLREKKRLYSTRGRTEMQGRKQTNPHTLETTKCERRVHPPGQSANNPQRNERRGNRCTARNTSGRVWNDRISNQTMVAVHKKRSHQKVKNVPPVHRNW